MKQHLKKEKSQENLFLRLIDCGDVFLIHNNEHLQNAGF